MATRPVYRTEEFLPPASAVEVIESVLSVCVSVCALTTEPFDVRTRNVLVLFLKLFCGIIDTTVLGMNQ